MTDPGAPAPGNDHPHDHPHDLRDRLTDAAIEAELESGAREETVEQARAHVAVRIARMSAGFLILLVGILMIPLPGPGWLAVAAGLAILARDVAWADRALRYVRRRIPGVPEDGKIPRSAMLTMVVLGGAGFAGSLWWTLR